MLHCGELARGCFATPLSRHDMGMCRSQRAHALLTLDEKLRKYEDSCQHLMQAHLYTLR